MGDIEDEEVSYLQYLPQEVKECVLCLLAPRDIISLCLTCNSYYREDWLWRLAFVQTFPSYSSSGQLSWQTAFVEAMNYETRWRTGQCEVKKLAKHKGGVSCLSISSGLMVSGSADCDILLWDLETATCIGTLKGHTQGITCVIMNEEKDIVISGDMSGCIIVWSLSSRQMRYTLDQHTSSILCINYQPKTNTLLSGSGDYTARVYDLSNGNCRHVLSGHRGNIICIESNDKFVVTGSKDATAMIWSLETGEPLHKLTGHTDDIYCLALFNGLIVTGSLDCRLKLWKEETGELLQTVQAHKGDVLAMMSRAGSLFTASVDRTIRMWRVQSDRTVKDSDSVSMVGHSAAVELLALGGPRSSILVSASSDKTVRGWDADTCECLFEVKGFEWVLSLQADESRIAVASAASGDISLITFDEPSPPNTVDASVPNRRPSLRKKTSSRHIKSNCCVQ